MDLQKNIIYIMDMVTYFAKPEILIDKIEAIEYLIK